MVAEGLPPVTADTVARKAPPSSAPGTTALHVLVASCRHLRIRLSPGLSSEDLTPGPLAARGAAAAPSARPALPGLGSAGVPAGTPVTAGHVARRSENHTGLVTNGGRGGRGREVSWQGSSSLLGRVDSGVWTPPPAPVRAGAVGVGSRAQAQSRLCGRRPWAAAISHSAAVVLSEIACPSQKGLVRGSASLLPALGLEAPL